MSCGEKSAVLSLASRHAMRPPEREDVNERDEEAYAVHDRKVCAPRIWGQGPRAKCVRPALRRAVVLPSCGMAQLVLISILPLPLVGSRIDVGGA